MGNKPKPIPLPLNAETLARFWAKVNKQGPIPAHRPDLGPCHLWTAALSEGYGMFGVFPFGTFKAHRIAWALDHGRDIPAGLEPDHVCKVKNCIRASHLDAVTTRINTLRGASLQAQNARKTHCVHGHPLSGENLRICKGGARQCLACRRKQRREQYALRRKDPAFLACRRKQRREQYARKRKNPEFRARRISGAESTGVARRRRGRKCKSQSVLI